MTYNNYTMDELINLLSTEIDPDRFVEVSKIFVQKFVNDDYIPRSEWEGKIEDIQTASYQEGYDEGYNEGYDEGLHYEA